MAHGLTYQQQTPVDHSDRGTSGVAVFVQDQTTPLLDIPFLQSLNDTATLRADTVPDVNLIDANTGHGITAGNVVELANGGGRFYQGKVLTAGVNNLDMDSPLNRDYLTGATIFESNDDMLVDGSSTPVIFSILPLPTQKGDIVRIVISFTSSSAQDFETFGSMPALTNGCLLRTKREDGTFDNIFNWKNNGEFIERAFDYDYQLNNGGGVRSFMARRTFGGQSKNGVVIRLDGSLSEELQVVVQDDLSTATTNTTFRMFAQGHELQQ